MKQVNFSHSGGFPLEQETLERLQTAYRTELFAAIKSHLSIEKKTNYIVAQATITKLGWAIIHQEENDSTGDYEGILYPIQKGNYTGYLKTIRTGTNLIYGAGTSQTAYYDYQAVYINQTEFLNGVSQINDAKTIYFYDLSKFKVVKDIQSIERTLQAIEAKIDKIKADINLINKTYLPLDGSKAMQGDLDLSTHKLSKLDIKETLVANVRAFDFKLGSVIRRGLKHPKEPLGRALVDSSDQSTTSLTVNYDSDWDNTYIGGKVFLNNINKSNADGSLLVINNENQVTKSNTLIDSLLNRITALENKPATAVPIGMIAIWGKPAPFPEGWEESVSLRGRMPIGLDLYDEDFNKPAKFGGQKYKTLITDELPKHTFTYLKIVSKDKDVLGFNSVGNKEGASYEDATTNEIGNDNPFSILNPYRVVHFIEYTGRIAPNPAFLRIEKIGRTYIDLAWETLSNDSDIINYLIFKNDSLIATLNNVHTYSVSGLSRNRFYDFYVVAQNTAGILSAPSNIITQRTASFL